MAKNASSHGGVSPADIPVVILAGGRGTRLMEETQVLPKPMVTVGGMPIILHIMRIYGSYGFRKFIICLGYKGHVIKEFFVDLPKHTASLVVNYSTGKHEYQPADISHWHISMVETGENSLTATRLQRVASVIDAPHFCLTYGDGVSNVPLDRELEFHLRHGKTGTVAAVHPPSRFGRLDLGNDGIVKSFKEKESLNHDYINGGYFIFRREFLDCLPSKENVSLEAEPLTRLADQGQLCAFKHDEFWMCMDTLRDREQLEDLYARGHAPWVRW
jgi:glucose-1-phosphate cytidylyltransferase